MALWLRILLKILGSYLSSLKFNLTVIKIKRMNLDVYTTVLSILSCCWIIFKYFQQPKNNIGLLLIFVLAIADLVFACSILSLRISEETNAHDLVIFFSMQFSVMWASAVSYIVYKSLQDMTLKKMRLFQTTLGIVIFLSSAVTAL